MIAIYAFLAAFAVQVFAVSVLYPAWLARYARERVSSTSADLYPNIDLGRSLEDFLALYRKANIVVAVVGVLLLGWLFILARQPSWDTGFAGMLVTIYYFVQMLPLLLTGLLSAIYSKLLRRSLMAAKRKAVMQRRSLFDFVSPFVVFLAALLYVLFVAFVAYLTEHPFPGFAGYVNVVGVTLIYAVNAFVAYRQLYGKKNLFVTHEGRLETMGMTLKANVYSCIATVVFLSIIFVLAMLKLKAWEPFALSVFFIVSTTLCSMGFAAPPRRPGADGLDSGTQLSTGTSDVSA